jgi:WD40 repeat protein
VYSLSGSSGFDLDNNIANFTKPSIDVIFMGGDDSFSADTGEQIEHAVYSGKIMVVTNKNYQKINASLPAEISGIAPVGNYLQVTDPDNPVSQKIFAGLRTRYPNTDSITERFNTVGKKDSITLLSYDTHDPALIYGKYGNGYVIEWTMPSPKPYLNVTEADSINDRLISYLRTLQNPAPVSSTTIVPSTTIPPVNISLTTTPAVTLPNQTSAGYVMIYSSPSGAAILIDGDYQGTTPANITCVVSGYHVLTLTLSGYYDYSSKVYIPEGKDTKLFGTLNPVGLPPAQATSPSITTLPEPANTVNVSPTPGSGVLENSGVLVAIIGVITASIGAIATIFSHISKAKKE